MCLITRENVNRDRLRLKEKGLNIKKECCK